MKTISLRDKIALLPLDRQDRIAQLCAEIEREIRLTILDPKTGQHVTITGIRPR